MLKGFGLLLLGIVGLCDWVSRRIRRWRVNRRLDRKKTSSPKPSGGGGAFANVLIVAGLFCFYLATQAGWGFGLAGVALLAWGGGIHQRRAHAAHLVKKGEKAKRKGLHEVSVPDKIAHEKLRAAQFAAPITEQIGEITAGVLTIQLFQGHGSGFFVTEDGLALTNLHVVSQDDHFDAKRIGKKVALVGRRIRTAKDELDAALIAVAMDDVRPLRINRALPRIGEDVYAFGTPLDQSLEGTLTRGVVSAIREENGVRMIQSDVSILPGNSGGPLLDKWGNVIGISTEMMTMGGQPTNICRFIPIDEALRRLGFRSPRKPKTE